MFSSMSPAYWNWWVFLPTISLIVYIQNCVLSDFNISKLIYYLTFSDLHHCFSIRSVLTGIKSNACWALGFTMWGKAVCSLCLPKVKLQSSNLEVMEILEKHKVARSTKLQNSPLLLEMLHLLYANCNHLIMCIIYSLNRPNYGMLLQMSH